MDPKMQDKLLHKVGTKYKMVSLFQKRMRELVRGLPPLVTIESTDFWRIAEAEILEGKVQLIMGDEASKMRREIAAREAEDLARKGKSDSKAKPPESPAPTPTPTISTPTIPTPTIPTPAPVVQLEPRPINRPSRWLIAW